MIIVGYQGIGKSTLAAKDKDFIDLESGNFFIDGFRDANWYMPYCNIAESLSQQGYNVFVSSHKAVRLRLKESTEDVIAIVPNLNLKDQWIDKLYKRYEKSGLEKDEKAYLNAKEAYEKNIRDIMEDCVTVTIDNHINYNLYALIQTGELRLSINSLLKNSFDRSELRKIKNFLHDIVNPEEQTVTYVDKYNNKIASIKGDTEF